MNQIYINSYCLDDNFKFHGSFLFSEKEQSLLLCPQNGATIFLEKSLSNEILHKSPSDELKFKLIQRGMASTPNSRPLSQVSEAVSPRFFIIDLTQACVMRCAYCFRRLTDKPSMISDKVLDDILDYLIAYCHKHNKMNIDVQPWGGEPLLAFDKICHIDDRLKQAGITACVSVETCGVLFSDKLAEEAARRGIKIGISIDGVPKLHNQHRPKANGNDSFGDIQSGIEKLYQNGYQHKYSSITTVTKESLPFVESTVEFFCKEMKLPYFKFNAVKPNPQMKRAGLELTEEEVKDFYARMFDKYIEMRKQGCNGIETNIGIKILNLLGRKCGHICLARGCMGGRKMISFDSDGRIFPCDITDLKEQAFGTIYEGRDLIEMVEQAMQTHPYFQTKHAEKCDSCPWRFYCRGGCTSAELYRAGKLTGEIDRMECSCNETLYPKIVEIMLTDPELAVSLTEPKFPNDLPNKDNLQTIEKETK